MSNELTIFDNAASIPEHIRAAMSDGDNNIEQRGVSVPTLSYAGKVWTISANGQQTKVTRTNPDGDVEPAQTIRVVILGFNKQRGRAYYDGPFDPARTTPPDCFSDDSISPDPSVGEPQSKTCATCPKSFKGSRMAEGNRPVVACALHRYIVVIPEARLMDENYPPLRMKLAITSLWDDNKELMDQKWFAFDNYMRYMGQNGIQKSYLAVTKMRFNPEANFPRVIFSPDRWLGDAELERAKELSRSTSVSSLLKSKPPLDTPLISAPKPALKLDDDDGSDASFDAVEEVIPPAKPKAAKPPPAKVVDLDADDGVVVNLAPAAPKTAAKASAKKASAAALPTDDIDALVTSWESDE